MAPYHYQHGSLREALLAEARTVLVRDGIDGVTMRGLAKRLGVSHGAPRRHFTDRDALLDALVAQGFDELTELLGTTESEAGHERRLTSYVRGHVRFATTNAALMEAMFSAGSRRGRGPEAAAAADRFFTQGRRLLGGAATGPPDPLVYVLTATVEGIGALVTTGRLPLDRVDGVVALAVELLSPALRHPARFEASAGPGRPAGAAPEGEVGHPSRRTIRGD